MKKRLVRKADERSVIWAVDPHETGCLPSAAAISTLVQWAKSHQSRVLPTYVATVDEITPEFGNALPLKNLEDTVNRYANRLLPKGLALPAKVVMADLGERNGAARALYDFASNTGSNLLALTSHGRSGLDRFFLGSFAESVLRESPDPVLFLSPDGTAVSPQMNKIVFATDFSPNSRIAYRKLIRELRGTGYEMNLFHAVVFPMPYAPENQVYVPDNFYSAQVSWAKRKGAEWVKEAEEMGISANLTIRDGGLGLISAGTIQKFAAEIGAAMIALAAKSGALDRLLFGSAAFELFRARSFPILLYGPAALKKSKNSRSRLWRKSMSNLNPEVKA